jgi:hypothetical protein
LPVVREPVPVLRVAESSANRVVVRSVISSLWRCQLRVVCGGVWVAMGTLRVVLCAFVRGNVHLYR